VEIINEEEFRIDYSNFYIAYNKTQDLWYARHENEDLYEEDVIIDIENLKDKPVELFDGFILDIQEFKEIEGLKNTII